MNMYADTDRCDICNKTIAKTWQYGGWRWAEGEEVKGNLLCDRCFSKIRPAYEKYLEADRILGMEIIMARKRADIIK